MTVNVFILLPEDAPDSATDDVYERFGDAMCGLETDSATPVVYHVAIDGCACMTCGATLETEWEVEVEVDEPSAWLN